MYYLKVGSLNPAKFDNFIKLIHHKGSVIVFVLPQMLDIDALLGPKYFLTLFDVLIVSLVNELDLELHL